jgi:hypothetical protein
MRTVTHPSWTRALPIAALCALAGCPPEKPDPDPTHAKFTVIADGVNLYDFSQTTAEAYVVTVDRNSPNYEVRVLSHFGDPVGADAAGVTTTCEPVASCAQLDFFTTFPDASRSLVAIPGPVWDGDTGDGPGGTVSFGKPTLTTMVQGIRYPASRPDEGEEVFSFSPNGGNGIGFAQGHATDRSYTPPFGYVAVASQTVVMQGGQCAACAGSCDGNWNVIGASPTQIVFLAAATADIKAATAYCDLLAKFGVSDAITTAGHSAQMLVGAPDSGAPVLAQKSPGSPYEYYTHAGAGRVLETIAVVPIKGAGGGPTCTADARPGNYCGSDPEIVGGDPSTLYGCGDLGGAATVLAKCEYCHQAGGGNDSCQSAADGGATSPTCSKVFEILGDPITKCGDEPGIVDGASDTLYWCKAVGPAVYYKQCTSGCVHTPESNEDYCATGEAGQ